MTERDEKRIKARRHNLELAGLIFKGQNNTYEEWVVEEDETVFVVFYYYEKRIVIGTYTEKVNGFAIHPWKLKAISEYENAVFVEYALVVD